jgi:hypothetical protein
VDLNAHEAGNGGKKPREAYSLPSLLYSEENAQKSNPRIGFVPASFLGGKFRSRNGDDVQRPISASQSGGSNTAVAAFAVFFPSPVTHVEKTSGSALNESY